MFHLFIYLFWAVLGLCFCARAFSSCGEQGPLFIAVHGPLTIAASIVVEHGLQTRRLSCCSSRAQLLRGLWDLPRPGLEPVSPALAGGFLTTAPPGKPRLLYYYIRTFFVSYYGLCLKVYFVWYKYSYPSFLTVSVCMEYLFPSLYFQSVCVLKAEVSLL